MVSPWKDECTTWGNPRGYTVFPGLSVGFAGILTNLPHVTQIMSLDRDSSPPGQSFEDLQDSFQFSLSLAVSIEFDDKVHDSGSQALSQRIFSRDLSHAYSQSLGRRREDGWLFQAVL
jgi:hypothetical protein